MKTSKKLLIGIAALVLPVMAAQGTGFTQEASRWRNDDGGEAAPSAGASWKAAENTPITSVTRDANIRLRFAVSNRRATGYNRAVAGTLEYAEATNGSWTAVGLSLGRPFQMATTTGYANGDPTTGQLTVPGLVFAAGKCVEDPSNTGTTPTLVKASNYSELEYCFRATSYAKRNTTYYFRISNGGTPLDYYDCYAALTIEDTDAAAPSDIYVDDSDTAHITQSGYWPASGSISNAWNAGCSYGAPTGETQEVSFRWIPEVPQTGEYQVYARWTSAPYRGRYVPYTIAHAGGTTAEIPVNQRDPALVGQWNSLGTYTFNAGTSGYIEMSGNDGQACADAIKLTRVGAVTDADGDGMPDDWENTYLGGTGASPTADMDSDGLNNLQEFQAGTNPTNAASVLAVVGLTGLAGETLELKWLSVDGKTYKIQKSTNLTEGFTLMVATNISADAPTNSYSIPLGEGGSGFYRVKLE